MELIPFITNIIFYFLTALVFVLIVSFIFFKTFKNKHEEKTTQNREQLRKIIKNHHQYARKYINLESRLLNQTKYSAPTYSNDVKKITNNSEKIIRENKSSENNRYSILNTAQLQNKTTLKNFPLN
ncbi:MAG TPA: hypothetical protein ENN33_02370 [Ignavibacteria bacterium]|nr:hypothetical protein [Ignavibacteria bacterium]